FVALEGRLGEVSSVSGLGTTYPLLLQQEAIWIHVLLKSGKERASCRSGQMPGVELSVEGERADSCADGPVHTGWMLLCSRIVSHALPSLQTETECTVNPY